MKDWQRSPEPEAMMGARFYAKPSLPVASSSSTHVEESSVPDDVAEGEGSGHSTEQKGEDSEHAPKVHRTRQLPSLRSLCRIVLMRNIANIEGLGDMPFRLAKDILEQMRPVQLAEIEEASPHLAPDTDYIWQRHTFQDFPKIRKAYEANELKIPKRWRKLYLKSVAEREEQLANLGLRAKQRYAEARNHREQNRTVITEKIQARIPGTSRSHGRSGPQSKGSKLLSKSRISTPTRIRAPRLRRLSGAQPAPPTDLSDNFVERWKHIEARDTARINSTLAKPRVAGKAPAQSGSSTVVSPTQATTTKWTYSPKPKDTGGIDFFSSGSQATKRKASGTNTPAVTVNKVLKRRSISSGDPGSPGSPKEPSLNVPPIAKRPRVDATSAETARQYVPSISLERRNPVSDPKPLKSPTASSPTAASPAAPQPPRLSRPPVSSIFMPSSRATSQIPRERALHHTQQRL